MPTPVRRGRRWLASGDRDPRFCRERRRRCSGVHGRPLPAGRGRLGDGRGPACLLPSAARGADRRVDVRVAAQGPDRIDLLTARGHWRRDAPPAGGGRLTSSPLAVTDSATVASGAATTRSPCAPAGPRGSTQAQASTRRLTCASRRWAITGGRGTTRWRGHVARPPPRRRRRDRRRALRTTAVKVAPVRLGRRPGRRPGRERVATARWSRAGRAAMFAVAVGRGPAGLRCGPRLHGFDRVAGCGRPGDPGARARAGRRSRGRRSWRRYAAVAGTGRRARPGERAGRDRVRSPPSRRVPDRRDAARAGDAPCASGDHPAHGAADRCRAAQLLASRARSMRLTDARYDRRGPRLARQRALRGYPRAAPASGVPHGREVEPVRRRGAAGLRARAALEQAREVLHAAGGRRRPRASCRPGRGSCGA